MERFLVRGGLPSAPKSNGKRKAESCSSDSSTTKKKRSKRSYDPKYLAYGFTWTGEEDHPKPQCVLCYKILANESFKPCKLQRHLEGDHPEFKTKSLAFFEKKKNELGGEQRAMKKATTANEKGLHASYIVADWIAKTGKPHTLAESFWLPCTKDVVSVVFGQSTADQLATIPLSDDTISRRIDSMADDVKSQVVEKLKQSPYFAIQLDETTDIQGRSHGEGAG